MDANTIKISLMLIVLIWSVISWITYMMRRSGNKDALRTLKHEGQALRTMTAEEAALVQPFLVSPLQTKKAASLTGDGVFALKGAFVRHGLETGQGGSTLHDTLGEVDVVLPYDARDYLREHNEAEVVMTDKFAIVVALNGEFDIAGGRERDRQRQKKDQQWSSGKIGALQDVGTSPSEASPDDRAGGAGSAGHQAAAGNRDADGTWRVDILSQRDETPDEVADRQHPGIAFWISMVWLLAFAGLAITAAGGGVPFAAASAVLALLALGLTWRRRKPGVPQKVNRARGELNVIVLTNPENSQVVSTQMFLGDKLPIKLPEHWRSTMTLPADGPVDVDMRVDDYSVVRMNGKFALGEEQRQFPRVFWGRHVTLALVGLLAGVGLWLSADDLKGDAALTRAWLSGAQPKAYATAAALANDLPAVGDVVAAQGKARCELRPDAYSDRIGFDCEWLRWGANAPQNVKLDVDDTALQLYSGEFIKTRANPMVDMLLRSQRYGQMRGDPMSIYSPRQVTAATVVGLSKTVQSIEAGCEPATGEAIASCDQLKRTFVDNIMLAKAEPQNWLELIKLVEAGEFTGKGRSDEGVLLSPYLNEVRNLAKSSTEPAIRDAMRRASDASMAMQQGGAVWHVLPGPYATLPEVRLQNRNDLLAVWAQQQRMGTLDGQLPFQLEGLVVNVAADATGAPIVTVDASRSLSDPWPSAAHMVWLLLAGLLVVVHAPLAVLRQRAARAREKAVAEYAQVCGAKPSPFF